MNIKEFLKINWVYSHTRRQTFQKSRLYRYGFGNGVFGYKSIYEINRCKDENVFSYYDVDSEIKFKEYLSKKLHDKKIINKEIKGLANRIDRKFSNYIKYLKKLPQDYSKFTNLKLVKFLNDFVSKENDICVYFWILFSNVEKILEATTKERLLSEGVMADEVDKIIHRLSEPIKVIPLDAEKLSLLEIVVNSGNEEKMLLAHWKKFAYMPMYDIDFEPYPLQHFQEKLKEFKAKYTPETAAKKIDIIKKAYKERINFYNQSLKKFRNKKDLLYLVEFLGAYTYLKDLKPYARDNGSFYIKNLFIEISNRLNLTLTQVLFLQISEMQNMLEGKAVISKTEVQKRIKDSVFLGKGVDYDIITDEKIIKQIDEALIAKEKVSELKGTAVSVGQAKAQVCIVLSNNDFFKFKEGQVLVTSATRPDFVPLMKKAVAIITDEGGILSHAAIISRELKKPCIVGTGRATLILKDGDFVKVDANKGTVKIISKNR